MADRKGKGKAEGKGKKKDARGEGHLIEEIDENDQLDEGGSSNPPNSKKPWSDTDRKRIEELYKKHRNYEKVAQELGRSAKGVTSKLHKMRHSSLSTKEKESVAKSAATKLRGVQAAACRVATAARSNVSDGEEGGEIDAEMLRRMETDLGSMYYQRSVITE
ncbi:hypothetical protein MRB53_003891 [Persea americana]|uniref:Uncharacterized protein n=1 Tax=Persea americana TaxID=3435 RepID=A0ACC2MZC1_PERAE|nr:hypothetical protein MRB53_003891 [Persea americana]